MFDNRILFFFLENVCSNRESEDLASKPSIEKIKDVQNFRSTMSSSPRKRVGYQSTLNVLNERGQTTCQTHQPPRKLGESAGIKVGGIGCTASFEN